MNILECFQKKNVDVSQFFSFDFRQRLGEVFVWGQQIFANGGSNVTRSSYNTIKMKTFIV